jgi:hypothetical protein
MLTRKRIAGDGRWLDNSKKDKNMKRMAKLVMGVMVAGGLVGSASAVQIHNVATTQPYTWEFVGNALSLAGYSQGESANGSRFGSFCIEGNENYTGGGTYYVEVSGSANNGGVNTDANDPLSVGTAWLYSQFAKGTLSGYVYGNSVAARADASALQNAIWMLENEIAWDGSNEFIELAGKQGLGSLSADATAGQFGVSVLNLWTTYNATSGKYSGYAQDQLYYAANSVPDGGMTLAMAGIALAGIAAMRRRK